MRATAIKSCPDCGTTSDAHNIMCGYGRLMHGTNREPFTAPFSLPEDSFEFMLDLPCPPSVNKLRKIDPVGHKLRKEFYRQADMHVMAARSRSRDPLPVRKIKGAFEASLLLNEKMNKLDADNAIKVVIDYLVSREFVVNDSPKYLRRLIVEWGCPSSGCRVVVRSLHEPVR